MFRPLVRSHRRPPRRGTAILITCFFLITVMMVTGLALVMYAAKEKAAALAFQDGAATTGRSLPDPNNTVNQFLGTLIYDTPDDGAALQNTMRGHSIARSMYGSRSDFSTPANPWVGNTTPWNGVGTFHEQGDTYGNTALNGVDRARMVNHTVQVLRENPADPNTGKPVLLDPEWTGARAVPAGGAVPTFATGVTNRNYVSKAAGYTYPDIKNFWLGARDPATGEVLVQSFHRDTLFGTLAPTNANWTNEAGKLLTLRPRPNDHLKDTNGNPLFPTVPPNADGTYTGDVQNLPGSYSYVPPPTGSPAGTPGRFISKNDSLWMHIGLPPITLSDGRRVQPLVAPLILPLDGSFDLSHHGNQLNTVTSGMPATTSYLHTSHGGQGAWEIDIGKGTATDTDRYNLMAQRNASRAAEFNPYVNAQLPAAGQQQLLPRYAPVSWSGALVNFKLPSEQVAPDNRLMLGLPSSGDPNFSTGAFGGFQNDNAQYPNTPAPGHPAGYNSNEFGPRNNTTNLSSPVYPWTDLKRMTLRYAHYPDWYSQAFVTKTAPTTFQGDGTNYPYFANPTTNLQAKYRLDPAHARRGLFVPRTMSLDRPALSPTFLNRDLNGTTAAVSMVTPAPVPNAPLMPAKPGSLIPVPALPATPAGFPTPQNPGAVTDFAPTVGTTQQWYNYLAQFGSVNLNRPLADYRDLSAAVNMDTTKTPPVPAPQPLGSNNMGNAAQAEADRQALARDIFVRLVIATGAAAQVDPTTGAVTLPDPNNNNALAGVNYTAQQYGALRYLAQLAVNIVDYIDNDDVMTTFVWNPPTAGALDYTSATEIANRVVVGVEKPRLVLNEVYSEITNAPDDPTVDPVIDPLTLKPTKLNAMKKAHVKFWAELVNPTSAPHATGTGVLGTGAVNLSAYQIQMARAVRTLGVMTPEDRAVALSDPANPLGRLPSADATYTFATANPAPTVTSVAPNDTALGVARQYDPLTGGGTTLPSGGFVLVGPPQAAKANSKEFTPPPPATATGAWAPASRVESAAPTDAPNSQAMGYTLTTVPTKQELGKKEFKRNLVLLRRLANPHLPPNDPTVTTVPPYDPNKPLNAYVTVDVMDFVPSFDAVHRAFEGEEDRGERPATIPAGKTAEDYFDPVADRFSVGKVQPLAGLSSILAATDFQDGAGKYNIYNGNTTRAVGSSLTTSMVREQTTTMSLPAATDGPNEPKNTLGRHNGNGATAPTAATVTTPLPNGAAATLTETVQFPFDWLIHMDRPLETQGDLFFVRDCPPHRLTTEFVYPVPQPTTPSVPGLTYTVSSARWTYHSDGLARALELLTVKSPKLGDAHGGRVGGKVNPNVVQDSRIAQGVWDPQTSNRFNAAFVTNTVWNGWMNSRSPIQQKTQADGTTTNPVPVPGSSVLDLLSGGTDRPFMSYGGPTVPNGSTGQFAYTAPPSTNDGDTFLRRPVASMTVPSPEPYLVLDTVADTNVNRHPYTQTDPLRKVMNNLTPVSHTFVVYFTIGYFDVKMLNPGDAGYPANYPTNINGGQVPQFGAEVYDQIPGDMRQKYMAVIDMSNMALKANPPANDADPHATVQPFFTALAGTARPTATPATVPAVLTLGSGGGNGTTFTLSTDGQTASFQGGNTTSLVIGYGVETQIVTVDAVGPLPASGMGSNPNYPGGLSANQIGVLNLTRTAWGGTCVSNVRPGYAGPRTDFNFLLDKYKPVVPYVERLR